MFLTFDCDCFTDGCYQNLVAGLDITSLDLSGYHYHIVSASLDKVCDGHSKGLLDLPLRDFEFRCQVVVSSINPRFGDLHRHSKRVGPEYHALSAPSLRTVRFSPDSPLTGTK